MLTNIFNLHFISEQFRSVASEGLKSRTEFSSCVSLDTVFSSLYWDNNGTHPQGVVVRMKRANDCTGRT